MTKREMMIAIVDNDAINYSDAIILLEGDGFHRYQKAVEIYHQNWAKLIVFSGGVTDYKYGSYPLSDVLPRILEMGVPIEAILHEDKSKNTKEQAIEIIKLAREKNWKRLILIASHEHQYRAYLTFLREVIDSKSGIVLYNVPVRNLGWFTDSGWGTRFDRLQKEFDRIEEYSALGHLATYDETIEYQKFTK